MTRFAPALLLALLSAAPAWAQEQGMAGMNMHAMGGMGNMHTMPATVTAVDGKTGLVDVSSENMPLKLHFPPASLAGLKAGDKITLHLGFSKP